jgi:peptide methionine sulfoxide reductase MsrA
MSGHDATHLVAVLNRLLSAPVAEFYQAGAYHQNYYADNQRQPYCEIIIRSNLNKLLELFRDKLK